MPEGWAQASVLAAAYAGTENGAPDLAPAARALRVALPRARLILLWPAAMSVPAAVARAIDERIEFPLPGPDVRCKSTRAARAASERTVAELRDACPTGVVIFTEKGHAPHLPAYLCCLAGVPRRAGLTEEFGGGILTNALPPPGVDLSAAERHLFLLDALGLGHRAEVRPVATVTLERPCAPERASPPAAPRARATGAGS